MLTTNLSLLASEVQNMTDGPTLYNALFRLQNRILKCLVSINYGRLKFLEPQGSVQGKLYRYYTCYKERVFCQFGFSILCKSRNILIVIV